MIKYHTDEFTTPKIFLKDLNLDPYKNGDSKKQFNVVGTVI